MRFTYAPGSTPLDGFTIEQGIGVGGFGEVYRAVSMIGKRVALKKIQRNLDIELRGVRQCINLKHVNLISLWDIKTDAHGESWVIMEYVPGPSLRDVVHAHPNGLPEEEVKRWFVSTASGVAYLHQQDIVHRDLKPGNIFLDEETQVIKIGDYGLSKYMNTSRRSGQTESVGTFHYMAPEIGRGVYGREIDIYALGIILFEILTGDVPFDGESTQEIIMKHLTDDPKLDRVPAGFRKAIRIAMQKDPELRYHTVPEMLADLPWPDIAENCQKIIAFNTVGPLTVSGKSANPTARPPGLDALEITRDHRSAQSLDLAYAARSGAPELIGDEDVQIINPGGAVDIVFGPLKDLSQAGSARGEVSAAEISFVPDKPALSSARASVQTDGAARSNSNPFTRLSEPNPNGIGGGSVLRKPASIELDYAAAGKGSSGHRAASRIALQPFEEPIARSIQTYSQSLTQWWTISNVSTPVKLIILTALTLIVVINSAWLLPLAFVLGMIYLAYYSLRTWWLGPGDRPINAVVQTPQSTDFRDRMRERTITQRLTELLASLSIAILACGVLSLLGMAVGGASFQPTKAIWQAYGWLALTSGFASCTLLLVSKFWENRTGETLMRRFAMVVIGVLVGGFSFIMANAFEINLSDLPQFGDGQVVDSKIVIKGMPILPALLIYYAGLFGILRWWRMADPMRKTRLSIMSTSFAMVWSSLFSIMLDLPVLPNCIMAVVISISIQLAAPWLVMEGDKLRSTVAGASLFSG
jgi:serine/threonine protein kinase